MIKITLYITDLYDHESTYEVEVPEITDKTLSQAAFDLHGDDWAFVSYVHNNLPLKRCAECKDFNWDDSTCCPKCGRDGNSEEHWGT